MDGSSTTTTRGRRRGRDGSQSPPSARKGHLSETAAKTSALAGFIRKAVDSSSGSIPMGSWRTVRNYVKTTLRAECAEAQLVCVTFAGKPWVKDQNEEYFNDGLTLAFDAAFKAITDKSEADEPVPETQGEVIDAIAALLVAKGLHMHAEVETVFSLVDVASKSTNLHRLAANALGEESCKYVRNDHYSVPDRTSIVRTESRTVHVRFREWGADGGDELTAEKKVTVVVGPSGSGKTSYMLTARPRNGPTKLVTFFVLPDDIKAWIKDRIYQYLKHDDEREAAEAQPDKEALFKALEPYLDEADTPTPKCSAHLEAVAAAVGGVDTPSSDEGYAKAVRNAVVSRAIPALVTASVRKLQRKSRDGPENAEPDATPLAAPGPVVRVRVAIDEAGEQKGIVRAVIATQGAIRQDVRRACHLTTPADKAAIPVDIMVGGTGCGAPDDPHGSAAYADKYAVVDMEARFSGWLVRGRAAADPRRQRRGRAGAAGVAVGGGAAAVRGAGVVGAGAAAARVPGARAAARRGSAAPGHGHDAAPTSRRGSDAVDRRRKLSAKDAAALSGCVRGCPGFGFLVHGGSILWCPAAHPSPTRAPQVKTKE